MSDAKDHRDSGPDEPADKSAGKTPPAGPHAKPDLTNPDATPGAGSLPDDGNGRDADGGVG